MNEFDWLFFLQVGLFLIGMWIIASQTPGNKILFKDKERTPFTWQLGVGYALGPVSFTGVIETLRNVLHWDLWQGILVGAAMMLLVYVPLRLIALRRRKPGPPDSIPSV